MDLSSLQHATDADRAVLGKVAKVIRKERALARAFKCRLDNLALFHQTEIAALSKKLRENCSSDTLALLDSKLEEARKEIQEKSSAIITQLQSELSTLKSDLEETKTEKTVMEQELSTTRQTAATDANKILQLREELFQLREVKDRIATESIQKHTHNIQLLRQFQERDSKVAKYEESNVFLKAEVIRLSQELVQTRTRLDSTIASHDAAISIAHKSNKELSNDLAQSNTRSHQLANELASAERNAIDLQADFDREKSDLQAEIDSLGKLVDMHREATKDAEIRLAGYTEVLATLAKERKEADRRPAHLTVRGDRHAEVLFKNLNKALDAKLEVLEKERHELIRARAAEARMATKHQALTREADTARRELNEMRQQLVTLEAELNIEKDKAGELERQLIYAGSAGGMQHGSAFPFNENPSTARPFGSISATPSSGGRLSMRTPSPFRQSRLGSAEQALAGMVDIRRRHEALLEGLKERREDYAELMHD